MNYPLQPFMQGAKSKKKYIKWTKKNNNLHVQSANVRVWYTEIFFNFFGKTYLMQQELILCNRRHGGL